MTRLSEPAAAQPRQFPRSQTERTIAVARVALAGSGLFAIWLDPAEPARYVEATYTWTDLRAVCDRPWAIVWTGPPADVCRSSHT